MIIPENKARTRDSFANQQMMDKITDLFRQRSGLKISERDKNKFFSAVQERMAIIGIIEPQFYYKKLIMSYSGPHDEFIELATLLVNHESYFFRDEGHCLAIKNALLPKIIENNREKKKLRVWCAGCSTGEEPYTMAIIITRLLPDWKSWNIMIVGTDISYEAIYKARLGTYKENALRGLSSFEKAKYFMKEDNVWVLDKNFSSLVRFQQGNLIDDNFPTTQGELHDIDLIICRNVFIYFHQTAIESVMKKFEMTLNPGGFLLLGHGEAQSDQGGNLKSHFIPGSFVFEKPKKIR